MKNILICALLALLRPFIRQHLSNNHQNILIVTTTALGDTLWATPSIESLRKSFPRAFICVLTSPIGIEVLKTNPHIDQLFCFKKPVLPRLYSLWKRLYSQKFDTILFFHASQRWTLPLCATLGATRIVGTVGINKGLDVLLTDPLPKIYEHEILRRLKIVERISGTIHSETLSFFLPPKDKILKKPGLWVMVHPGSKDPFKRWPIENFVTVARELKQQLRVEILITGTKEETALMEKMTSEIPGAHFIEPKLSLRALAAICEQMDLILCNDTGPFHLACALNRPVIGLFAPTDPLLCGPHRAPLAQIIAKKTTCTPCLKRHCREPFCQLQIGTCEVIDIALKMLTGI